MGYREDGTFGFADKFLIDSGITNPDFTYPARSIRFLEAQAALDKVRDSYTLHRGYIRNLDQPALGAEFPISKCKFQFNPQEIRQDVQMRQDIYHAILQDPGQLTQPLGAETSFAFDLVFDRSMELSSGKYKFKNSGFTNIRNQTTDIDGQNNLKDVYDIGVLADLRVFYAVIGQGFSKEMLDFQLSAAKKIYQDDKNRSASAGSPEVEIEFNEETIKQTMQSNYGNAAFLMPNPVRVLFSSLFMVDGFVTATSVAFLKFNSNMVPMQCKVTISMSAMYIGFANQKTFLSASLEDAGNQAEAAKAEAEAARRELSTSLASALSSFKFAVGAQNRNGNGVSSWDATTMGTLPVWALGIKEPIKSSNQDSSYAAFYAGFPNIKPVESGDTTKTNGVDTRVGADVDAILTLYENGATPTIAYTWTLKVYGPGVGSTAGITYATAIVALADKSYSSAFKLMGSYTASETCSSKEEWGAGTSGSGAAKERVRRRSYFPYEGGAPTNSAPSSWSELNFNDVPNYIKNSYYVVEININVSAKATTEAETNKSGTKSFVISGTDVVGEHKFGLSWLANL